MYSKNPGYLHSPSATLGVRRMGPVNWSKPNYSANAPLSYEGVAYGLRGAELNGVSYGGWGADNGNGNGNAGGKDWGGIAKWAGGGLLFGVIAYVGYSKLAK
jgi:hypothetical protein